MHCTSKSYINFKQTKKRATVLAFLICFIAISVFFKAFIWTNVDHVHDNNGVGGACITCAQIQNAESTLKQLGTAVIAGFGIMAGLYAVASIIKAILSNITVLTLVTSKIRMNN